MRFFQALKSIRLTSKISYRHSIRQLGQSRKKELRLAAIFLLLIFLPSGVLGYLSWRDIKNEKLLSRQKVVESYREFARLAAREIDNELENVQARLQTAIEKASAGLATQPAIELLDSLTEAEPLLFSPVLLTTPGQVLYPADLNLKNNGLPLPVDQGEEIAREYDLFNDLADRGDELEYQANDLDGAISVYQQILMETSSSKLHAIAYSHISRTLMKQGKWEDALRTYRSLLQNYPEARDLNKMNLRFLAQYQAAVCLHRLHRNREALETLIQANKDLWERSDRINIQQYVHFKDWIETLSAQILSSELSDSAFYKERFDTLQRQKKKSIGDQYFVQLFDEELRELIIKRKSYRPVIRYVSGQADNAPFLLGLRAIPDQSGAHISGLLGFRVNLNQLRDRIFPALLRHLKTGDAVALAVLDEIGDYVIGTERPSTAPVVTYVLDSPFKFWQLGVFLDDGAFPSSLSDFNTTLWLWLISLLLFSIFFGAYIFVRYARHEAHLSEMKSTFVSRVSHELRTPLTSIKMLAEHLEMLVRRKKSSEQQEFQVLTEQYIGVIRRESDRLGRLIENILDFSKIERGVKQYVFEYEFPDTVLRKAIDAFRPHAEARGLTIKTAIDDSLPELLIDADAITQAILNLLGNAVRYSGKEKTIEALAFRNRNHVCMVIKDQGIGISSAHLSKIFDEFYRIDQKLNSTQQNGMGLGLTLVKHIVQAHRGTVQVHSEEGRGSAFTIALPVPPDDDRETAEANSAEAVRDAVPN